MTFEQPTGMLSKDWVQLTMTDWPLVYDPDLVSQLLFRGEMGSLGLPISASTLENDLEVQEKLTLKLILAPQEMVLASTLVMEQSEAFPFLEDWYWVQAMLAEKTTERRRKVRNSFNMIDLLLYQDRPNIAIWPIFLQHIEPKKRSELVKKTKRLISQFCIPC